MYEYDIQRQEAERDYYEDVERARAETDYISKEGETSGEQDNEN